jgi:hypothetical protein
VELLFPLLRLSEEGATITMPTLPKVSSVFRDRERQAY